MRNKVKEDIRKAKRNFQKDVSTKSFWSHVRSKLKPKVSVASSANKAKDVVVLQNDVSEMNYWSKTWLIKFNLE